MSFSKRQGNDAVCYTKPLDSLKSWNDHFFWVDAFAFPASFPWNTKDPFPKSSKFNAKHYATLVVYRLRSIKMDLLSFIQTADPTKVRVGERQGAEDEPKLLDTTVGRVVPLLPIAPAHAESELDASVDRLFDEGGSGNLAEQGDSASGGHGVGIPLVSEAAKTIVEDGEPIPTLPFVTSSVSATPEREDEVHTDSATGLNIRTIGAPQRFVISSDSSHHSGANITEAEVDSFARPSVPLMTVATTVTSTVDPATTVKEKFVESFVFGGDSSGGGADHTVGSFSDLTSSDFIVSGIRTVISPNTDLQKVYVPQWNVTNGSRLDAVRVCLLLVAELVFMGKEDMNCLLRHLVSLVEDFDCWNDYPWGEYMWVKFYKRTVNVAADHRALHLDKKKQNPDYYPTYNLYGFPLAFKIWILESYPNSRKWWSKKDNMLPRALAWSNVTKFGKNDYNGLLGPDSNPNLELYATPVEQQTDWFKASIKYINGLVDLDMNVSEDDIGGDVSNNSFDLNDNDVSGNGNNDALLLEGGDGFVDSVGGDKNHECNQDKQPSLADVLHELRALRKEVALFKVDDARIAKLERILNDTFIPCNDRSTGNHNSVNSGLTTSANHPLSTCSRHVVDNPTRNNDSRNSNHNVVYTGLSCSANDHMSSCLSPEMPNDEVFVVDTAIHNADEMYDSPNYVTDNDVNESIGVSSNYSMLNTSCPKMHNAEVLVVGMGIYKADENIYNSNANDNDVNQGITISFNAHIPNSSGHEMPNAVVVVACIGIDKPDGHNDNPNANDNDVSKGIDPMSTCFVTDIHLAEVTVAGMEIDKGDGHIDIPTASDNDVNLAKSVFVNDPM
ncbi:hypothetical protein Tco_1059367, partial [Tanacetum coccineum]